MMRSFMYLRPGNLAKDFIIEQRSTSLSEIGRPKTAYQDDGNCMLKGVLAEADTRQKMRWAQLQHPITHTIVQTGKPMAKAEDKLVLGNRIFLVQGVDEPGSLGVCTIYYVEERADVK